MGSSTVLMVALLRGINVGKANRISMQRLREVLTGLGYARVRTHLNSGNAVFECAADAANTAAAAIETALASEVGLRCRVIVRTAAALDAAIDDDPLLDSVTDPGRHLVGFFDSVPDEGRAAALAGGEFGADRLAVRGEHAYLWCAAGILQSPLSKINWPARLGVEVTMRNWNTVLRLAAILAE